MASKNITLSIDTEVLDAFDAWRAGRPRGEALGVLLSLAPPTITAALSLVGKDSAPGAPGADADSGAEKPREAVPAVGVASDSPGAGASRQQVKQALGRAVLTQTETYVGVPPAEVVGDEVRKQEPTEEHVRNQEEFYSTKYVSTQGQNLRKHDEMNQDLGYDDIAQEAPEDDGDQRLQRRKGRGK